MLVNKDYIDSEGYGQMKKKPLIRPRPVRKLKVAKNFLFHLTPFIKFQYHITLEAQS